MDFTRENLVQIWGVLSGLAQEKTTAKGAYCIAKNKRIVETEVKSIEEAQKNQKLPDGIGEFESKRITLCEEFCDKDEEGKNKVNDNSFVITERRFEFNEALSRLRDEYKEALDARVKQEEEFLSFLRETVDINFHVINVSDLPDNITAQQLEVLGDIIVD